MLDVKAHHIGYIISEAGKRGVKTMEPNVEAEKAWVDTIVKLAVGREPFLRECTPGYYNNEGGELDMRIAKNNQYWRGPMSFVRILNQWRDDGSFPGLDVTT
jgi:cyclohexanone monooxygenase